MTHKEIIGTKNKKIKIFDIAIIIGSVITVGKFWDLFKSKECRLLEFQVELAKQLQESNFKQMEVNIEEAKYRSIFVNEKTASAIHLKDNQSIKIKFSGYVKRIYKPFDSIPKHYYNQIILTKIEKQ